MALLSDAVFCESTQGEFVHPTPRSDADIYPPPLICFSFDTMGFPYSAMEQDILRLTPEDQAKFVDRVDQAYPTVDSQNVNFVTALGNICSAARQLPTSAVLSAGLEKRGGIPVAAGGLADVWLGRLCGGSVAIKSYRCYRSHTEDLKAVMGILWKRVPTWRKLFHEHILPFRGINTTLFQLSLVYDWGENGNIIQYIASHPGADRPSLLLDVAKGLEYLHSLGIPHGTLKGANVVIDQKGHARLTEYGLAPINSNPSITLLATPGAVRTSRWLAPEIIDPSCDDDGMPVVESKAADVFAFAMLAFEVLTGTPPFKEQTHAKAAFRTLTGERPEFPTNAEDFGLTIHMQELLQRCWDQDPMGRPTMGEIVRRWQKLVGHSNQYNEKGPTPSISCPRVKSEVARLRTRSTTPQPNAGALNRMKKWVCVLF